MKRMHLCLSIASIFCFSPISLAEENTGIWDASAELGYLLTSGNSESETLNAKFAASKTVELWKHALKLEALNSSQSDSRSAEKYVAGFQSDYTIDDRSYLLGTANWEKDLFSSYDYQASIAFGYGRKLIFEEDRELSLEFAPGYRISESDNDGKVEEPILRVAQIYKTKLSDTSTFDQSLSVEWGDSNTATRFDMSLTSQIAGNLSMKVAYGIKNNSDVAPGSDKTDTETSVTLVYTF